MVHSIECGGDDDVFVNTMVNTFGASLAEITLSCGDTAVWQSTAPGTVVSLFCSGGNQPSRLAAAVYGRP